jgi:hypothetical protein
MGLRIWFVLNLCLDSKAYLQSLIFAFQIRYAQVVHGTNMIYIKYLI